MRRVVVVALLAFALLGLCRPVFAASYSFTTIDVPFDGACCTAPNGINRIGVVVGSYADVNGVSHGFSDEDGEFTTIDVPGAIGTVASGINDRGEIVGSYTDGSGSHGFLSFKKKLSTIDFPAAVSTSVNGINKRGQIVGSYFDGSTTRGFLRSSGQFSTIDFAGATFTSANAIDKDGAIVGDVGFFSGGPFNIFGFLDDHNVITTYRFTGALQQFTYINGINSGVMVGVTGRLGVGEINGFVTSISGSFFQILYFPGSLYTSGDGINSEGQIVGTYTTLRGRLTGFWHFPNKDPRALGRQATSASAAAWRSFTSTSP